MSVRGMRSGAAWATLAAAGIGLATPAAAQGDLGAGFGAGASGSSALSGGSGPAFGSGIRVGDLRSQLERLVGGVPLLPPGVAWRIVPSIGVDVGVTDNARRIVSPRETDVFTQISPGLLILGDTPRVNLNLNYTPLATLYASTPGQNRLDHYLNAGARVTVVPERFLIDARAYVSQQSLTGGFGQAGFSQGTPSAFNRNDQVQTASFQVTPSLVNRFGGLGTAELLYTFAYTTQNNQSGGRFSTLPLGSTLGSNGSGLGTSGSTANLNNQGFFPQNSLITHRERGTFTTGEDFGRIQNLLLLEAIQFDGAGTLRGAYRREASVDSAYAINRTVSALGKVGYQQVFYSGLQGYQFEGITWNAGIRLTPNPDDFIELRYGRRDGFNDFLASAAYSPTARTRLFARYNTGVTSNAQRQQNLLSTTNVNTLGGSVDTITGAPVSTTSGFFGTQNGVFELRQLSITGIYVLARDSVTVTLVREERSPVGNGGQTIAVQPVTGFRGDSGTYGTVAWQHDLSADLRTNVSLQAGTRSVSGGSSVSERTLSASAGTSYQLSETLSSRATYVFNQRTGGGNNRSFTENILLVGLRKTF